MKFWVGEEEILNYSEINQILIQNMIMGFSRDKKSSSNKGQGNNIQSGTS